MDPESCNSDKLLRHEEKDSKYEVCNQADQLDGCVSVFGHVLQSAGVRHPVWVSSKYHRFLRNYHCYFLLPVSAVLWIILLAKGFTL